jgi:hypothetical protein
MRRPEKKDPLGGRYVLHHSDGALLECIMHPQRGTCRTTAGLNWLAILLEQGNQTLAGCHGGLGCLQDPLEEKLQPLLPLPLFSHLVKQTVIVVKISYFPVRPRFIIEPRHSAEPYKTDHY